MKAYYEDKTYVDGFRVNVYNPRDFTFLAHWHRDLEFVFVCDGRIRIGVNNTEQILNKGDYCIVGSSEIHFYDSKDLHSNIIILTFDPAYLGVDKIAIGAQRFLNPFIICNSFTPDINEKIRKSFIDILEEYNERPPHYDMLIKSKIIEIYALFLRHKTENFVCIEDKTNPLPYINAIKTSIKFLELNYANPITLGELASNVNLSPYYFSRLFKKISGMNFKEYLDIIRIEKAEIMIKEHNRNISEIAFDCGFNSIRTFNRVFKSVKSYAPSKGR